MFRLFASMKFAFWNIVLLIVWLYIGSFLAGGMHKHTFSQLNIMHLTEWCANFTDYSVAPVIWIVIFCLLGISIFVSAIVCTYQTLFKTLNNTSFFNKKFLLLSIHICFIFMLIIHGINMSIGAKYGQIQMRELDTIFLNDKISIHVNALHFADDTLVLMKQKKHSKIRYTKDNFSIEENYAEFSILEHDQLLHKGKAYFLKPFTASRYRITIEDFVLISDTDDIQIGVKIIFTKNHIIFLFFAIYTLFILLMLLYITVTWNKSTFN